jgi:hypothetical protein
VAPVTSTTPWIRQTPAAGTPWRVIEVGGKTAVYYSARRASAVTLDLNGPTQLRVVARLDVEPNAAAARTEEVAISLDGKRAAAFHVLLVPAGNTT